MWGRGGGPAARAAAPGSLRPAGGEWCGKGAGSAGGRRAWPVSGSGLPAPRASLLPLSSSGVYSVLSLCFNGSCLKRKTIFDGTLCSSSPGSAGAQPPPSPPAPSTEPWLGAGHLRASWGGETSRAREDLGGPGSQARAPSFSGGRARPRPGRLLSVAGAEAQALAPTNGGPPPEPRFLSENICHPQAAVSGPTKTETASTHTAWVPRRRPIPRFPRVAAGRVGLGGPVIPHHSALPQQPSGGWLQLRPQGVWAGPGNGARSRGSPAR